MGLWLSLRPTFGLFRFVREGRFMRLIAQACLVRFRKRAFSLLCILCQFGVGAYLFRNDGRDSNDQSNCRWLVTCVRFNYFRGGLNGASVAGVASSFTCMSLAFYDYQAVILDPLSRALSRVVSVPRPAVRRSLRAFIPNDRFLIDRDVIRVDLSDLFVALRRNARVFEAANATFCLRRPCANVRRLVRGVGHLRIFK